MIVDCFPYFNEKELLEFRIKLLNDYVDKFIIVDANRTHQGKVKPFTCKNTLKELGLDNEKVQVIELDLSWADDEEDSWVREKAQRNELAKYIKSNDICIISDCDEIIDPECIPNAINVIEYNPGTTLILPMYYLLYRADIRSSAKWNASYVSKGSTIKNITPSYYREKFAWGGNANDWDFPVFLLERADGKLGGWHFSWMGNNSIRKVKNESMATHGTLNEEAKDTIMSFEPQLGGKDLFGRENNILSKFDTTLLPKIIWDLPNVKNFLFPEK